MYQHWNSFWTTDMAASDYRSWQLICLRLLTSHPFLIYLLHIVYKDSSVVQQLQNICAVFSCQMTKPYTVFLFLCFGGSACFLHFDILPVVFEVLSADHLTSWLFFFMLINACYFETFALCSLNKL